MQEAKPRIGLALAGGGFLGAAYELGALAALQESIEGLDLTKLDTYVGVSAGSFLAAGLANGLHPQMMVRLFIEDDSPELVFDPATMLSPDLRQLRQSVLRAPRVLGKAVLDGVRSEGFRPKQVFWRAIERSGDLLPEGLIDASPARARLRHLLKTRGISDDFRKLTARLRIVATDVDSGEPIEFGGPRFDDVPISTAVAASSAVPGLFAPVAIGERRYLDGAINKTLHASVALREGAQLVFCINPLVPYSGSSEQPFRRMNLPGLLSQSIRTAIRSRMSVGLEKYRATHPDAHVLLFEPRRDDAQTFFTGMFSLANRRRLCEHAYQQTRRDLLQRSEDLAKPLASAGLKLDLAVLTRPDLTLVGRPSPGLRSAKPLPNALRRLDASLDELQRALRLAGQKV